jgi:hypothetical protein
VLLVVSIENMAEKVAELTSIGAKVSFLCREYRTILKV